jgi:predicted DsbA family dithiol-disulfide isomerase
MKVIVYIDYVCPYCLLAEEVIVKAAAGEAVEIDWRPFELRPDPVPTLRPEDPYLPTVWQQSVYPLAARLGVPIRLPSASPQPRSTKAFELFCFASDRGVGNAYNIAVLKAFFQEDLDIGDPETLADIAASVGLDRADAHAVLADGRYTARHRAALADANSQDVHSVPTIVIGKQVFRGVPGVAAVAAALRSAEATASV